ncbi:transcriptional regulator, GntR family [Heliomicrobium modesticaldum Ice1]|uniref:Transcriptional regulator, GntR family n=1 Tax=Heliobacterium modesticaldum (strain ATCC 51547 / Ice1) TaxID=498761 RepID=B0TIF9_HELMI|nr:FadR/GntR family transcriptional regulator [Heliomicrobium modesticaldum]ABZ84900.1 transcriptional regulator, GntR family [Heliomicrobium modesticaldum Ice1]
MELRPIRTKKIYEEIVVQIKELVKSGNLKAGDRLLSERELAENLKVSRAAVREALSALEAMGIVDIKPGDGAFIRQPSENGVIEPLAMLLLVEKDLPRQILEVRKIMEVGAAGLAAQRRKECHLKSMKAALLQMEQDIQNGEVGEEADFRFHFALSEAADNSLLLRLMQTISDTMRETQRSSRIQLLSTPGVRERLLEEHRGIFRAVEAQDTAKAQELMYDHLQRVEQSIYKSMEK